MLCASGRWVRQRFVELRVVGPNDFWCCKRSRFLCFLLMTKLGDFLHCCIYEWKNLIFFLMIYVNCLEKLICPLHSPNGLDWHFHPFPTLLGRFARRCGHVLGVVTVTFVTWWWASSTFPGSKQITASILQADQTASWSFSYFFWLGVWFDFCKSCQLVKQVSGFLLLIHFLIVVELLWLMLLSFTYIRQYLIRHV